MNVWIRLIIAYLITFAVYNTGGFSSSDILMGLVFFGTYMLTGLLPDGKKSPAEILQDSIYSQIHGRFISDTAFNKRLTKTAGIVTFIWTALYAIYMGGRINRDLDNPLFRAVYAVLTVVGLYLVMYLVIRSILVRILFTGIRQGTGRFDPKVWLKYSLIIFVFMLPVFLLNHPGTLTVDSFEQLLQVQGLKAYSDHHPWVHTMIIKALYSVGYAVSGSVYGGIATYTLFQMLIIAMTVAYAIESMTEGYEEADNRARKVRIIMLLGFVIYPYNLAYSITMWKDVLFAAAVLLLTVTIYRMYVLGVHRQGKENLSGIPCIRDTVLFIIGSLGMCLLRHNGKYAYIITMCVILIYEIVTVKTDRGAGHKSDQGTKRSPGRYARLGVTTVSVALVLLGAGVIKGPVQRAYNVETGDYAHSIPIPLQQVARVIYDGYDLTDE